MSATTHDHGVCLTVQGLFLGLTVCLITACASDSPPPETPPQHVIIIVVDSLRADHMGCYGYERDTSPFLDTLAAEGTVFERAYSQSSFTVESTLSLFTGVYPSVNPWGAGQYGNTNPDLSDMARQFSAGGYHTAYFSNNPTLNLTDLHKSFDEFEFTAFDFEQSGYGPRLTERALACLAERAAEKTFLYLHYVGPHWPYAPPDDYYLRFAPEIFPEPLSLVDDVRPNVPELVNDGFAPGDPRFEDMLIRYDGEIAFEDMAISNLFSGLRMLGLQENTLVVFTADHGEEFLEHGFVEHAWALYPESIHVPLFFWMPKALPAGRVNTPVGLTDVYPTLLTLADLPHPGHAFDGSPLFEKTGGTWTPNPENKPIISELLLPARNMARVVVNDNYLYKAASKWLTPAQCSEVARNGPRVRTDLLVGITPEPDPWGQAQYEALFDLEVDPKAMNTILHETPEVATAMRAILTDYEQRCPPQIPDAQKICRLPPLITVEIQAFLEAKGYLESTAIPEIPLPEQDDLEEQERIENIGYF